MKKIEREYLNSVAGKAGLKRFIASKPNKEEAKEKLGDFISDCFDISPTDSVRGMTVQELYRKWANKNSVDESFRLNNRELGSNMKMLFESRRLSEGIHYMGLAEKGTRDFGRFDFIAVKKEGKISNEVVYSPEEVKEFAEEYLTAISMKDVEITDLDDAKEKLDDAGFFLVNYSKEAYDKYNKRSVDK